MDCADAPPRHRIDRPNARAATLPPSPSVWPMTAGQSLGSGVRGDRGERHVDDHPPPSDRLRYVATDCHRAAGPGARRPGTRWRYPPAGERLGVCIARIDAAETQAGQARCRTEISLARSATARARTLFDGRTVTIMRVGRSYNRTVARVTLAGRDVGSERVVTDVVRWQHKPDWRAHADEDKGIAAPRPAPAGRSAADIQGISRSGGTAKSPAAKWARIAS